MQGKKMRTFLISMGALAPLLSFVPQASATPVYARQTGFSCAACHFEQFPLLNAFGRSFKANGYIDSGLGKQGRIEDDNLSLPSTLNASFVSKLRYQKTNGTANTVDAGPTNYGNISFPDEAFLTIGGRVSKNIGFQVGLSVVPDDVTSGKILSDFKMPISTKVDDFTLSAIPFTTSAQGPAYGFELLNTGAVEFARAFENAEETSAQQYLGTAHAASGVALVVAEKIGFTHIPFASYLFAFAALLSITFGTLYQKKHCPIFDLRAGSAIQFGISAFLAFWVMFFFESSQMVWNLSVIAALFWAVIPLSIGSISLLFMMIRKGAATKVTSLLYLTPPTTAAIAWLMFDEPFNLLMVLGLAITMTGVLLVNSGKANTVPFVAE